MKLISSFNILIFLLFSNIKINLLFSMYFFWIFPAKTVNIVWFSNPSKFILYELSSIDISIFSPISKSYDNKSSDLHKSSDKSK